MVKKKKDAAPTIEKPTKLVVKIPLCVGSTVFSAGETVLDKWFADPEKTIKSLLQSGLIGFVDVD